MKNITILIPTRNRIKKLLKTLNSIPVLPNIEILVVCDGDKKTWELMKLWNKHHPLEVKPFLIKNHVGAVKARNLTLSWYSNWDGVLYATDDIEFTSGSIECALKTFNKKFPDDDGVVGFVQDQNFHPTGVGLVGKKFLNRYPSNQLFYPGYYHFACQEILRFCETFQEKKFYPEKKALVKHYHPAYFKKLTDETHIEARVHKIEDLNLSQERTEKGLVWPLS